MNNIKKVLVPVDFSETSKNTLNYLAGLVKSSPDIEVTLLHICRPEQELSSSLSEELEALSKQWSDQLPSCVSRVEQGKLVDTIVDVQQDLSSDLIVMGTHGSDDEDNETNTSRLVLQADCPVLVIPTKIRSFKLKNIALALGENTIDNMGGLKALHDIARSFDATVHILTVNRNGGSPSVKEENQEILEYYLDSLLYFHAFPQNADIELGISEYIKEQSIDMLAILPRNHTKSTKPSEGRLTKLLTLHAEVPLLTVD